MTGILLIDNDPVHAEGLIGRLRSRSLHIEWVRSTPEAVTTLRERPSQFDLVILDVSDPSQPWLNVLDRLQHAGRRYGWSPLFLCVSNRQREPQFELAVERKGARYVYERRIGPCN